MHASRPGRRMTADLKRTGNRLMGLMRKEAGRPSDPSSDIIIKVEGLAGWEKPKQEERVNKMSFKSNLLNFGQSFMLYRCISG